MSTPTVVDTDTNFGELQSKITAGTQVIWTKQQRPKAIIPMSAGNVYLRDADGTEVTWECLKNFSPPIRPLAVLSSTDVDVVAVW